MIVAEDSTAWPMVTRRTDLGGLGFGFKWDMGFMHDTLEYLAQDPIHRRFHHHELTFALVYAWNENFVLPLSHDEVVHGKRSLLGKLPGDRWQRFANLRALYGLMWAHPGKKLLFMGGELAQEQEWSEDRSLDWHLLDDPDHAGVRALVRDLNAAYRGQPALWQVDFTSDGFAWLEPNAAGENVLAFLRRDAGGAPLVCVANLSPVVREPWRVGLPAGGPWREVLNTDSRFYGGSDVGNGLGVEAEPVPWNEQPFSAELVLPPLAVVWLVPGKTRAARPAQDSTKRR
jgi:1,4-alpha-glucan branching enzyme